jgi:N-acetyl-anhydromuramyl-L-alanine amidase AmpD
MELRTRRREGAKNAKKGFSADVALSRFPSILLASFVICNRTIAHGSSSPHATTRPAAAIRPTGIVLHHSAMAVRDRTGREQLARLARLHDDPRHVTWFHGHRYTIGYHYVILRDGAVVATRPEGCPGRHTRYRPDTIGICFAGDFSAAGDPRGAPTAAQLRAGARLCRRLMARYGWSAAQVVPHSRSSPTACPGPRFPLRAFLAELQAPRGGLSLPRGHRYPLAWR